MNYYERYCGDYASKTSRLTLVQHGAYTLLLDEYYSNETPLPSDFRELYKICRAMSPAEREAVRFVADKFFPVNGDGLRHNEKADEVLTKALKRINTSRGNGKNGGRPPKQKPSGLSNENPVGYETETQQDTQRATQQQTQPGIHQTPDPKSQKLLSGKPDLKTLIDLGVDEQVAKDWLAVRKAKRAPLTDTVIKSLKEEADKAGISVAEAVAVCAKRSWQGFNASWDRGGDAPGEKRFVV